MIDQEIIWTLKAFILPPGLLILTGLLGLLMGRRLLGKLRGIPVLLADLVEPARGRTGGSRTVVG